MIKFAVITANCVGNIISQHFVKILNDTERTISVYGGIFIAAHCKLIHPAALDVVLSCYSVIQPQHSWEQRSTPADNPYAILTTINQSINQSIIEWPFFKITYYNHWRCEYLPPPKMEVIFSGPAVRQPVIASPLAPWVHQTARYTLCKKRKYPLVNVVASLC